MKTLSLFATAVAISTLAPTASAVVERETFRVPSGPGVQLQVREVRDTSAANAGVPVILIHGARVPGVPSFDLPVEGGSLAADLAKAGHRVFVMDARGYGGSSRPGMDGPPTGEPLVRSAEVVKDVGAVVDDVSRRTGAAKVALLGWATGGHWAGMYASQQPGKVSHLVIHNSLYGAHRGHKSLGPGSPLAQASNPDKFDAAKAGSYRLSSAEDLMPPWNSSIPVTDKTQWRDPRVAQAYQQLSLDSDPTSQSRKPASFRAPSGAMADSFELASGRKLWDAATITSQVLVVRSELDFWSRPEDLKNLAEDLKNAQSVRAVTLPQATHHVHLDRPERGRALFLNEVSRFLANNTATTAASR